MITNFFDVIFLFIFAFCTLWGFFLGFFGSLVLFGFVFLGTVLVKAVHINLQSLILPLIGSPNLSAIVSFLIIIAVFILLAKSLRFLLNAFFFNLNTISRVLGGAVGFVIGIVFSHAFLYAISNYMPAFKDDIAYSKLAKFILNISQIF